jgi:hypothetical protein
VGAIIINILLGLWVMASPAVLALTGSAAESNYIAGPLIVTFGVIALWDINRSVRYTNVPIGLWVVVSAFVLPFQSAALWSNIIVGILVTVLSFVPAASKKQFGGGWKSLFEKEPEHMKTERL